MLITKDGIYKQVSKPAWPKFEKLGYKKVQADKPNKNPKVEEVEEDNSQTQEITFDDVEMKAGGHYYYDNEYLGHGEQSAREKLAEMNGGG